MTVQTYKGYFVISRPIYDGVGKVWFVYVNIAWIVGGHNHFHTIELREPHETEAAALSGGFRLAYIWVDGRLKESNI